MRARGDTHTLREFRRQSKDGPGALDAILPGAEPLKDRHERERLHGRDARRALQHGLQRQRRLRQPVVVLRVVRPAPIPIRVLQPMVLVPGAARGGERQIRVPERAEAEYDVEKREVVRGALQRRARVPPIEPHPHRYRHRARRVVGEPQWHKLVHDLFPRHRAEEPRRLREVEFAQSGRLHVRGQPRRQVVDVDAAVRRAGGGEGERGGEGRDRRG